MTVGSLIFAVLPWTSGLPAWMDICHANFHGSKLSL